MSPEPPAPTDAAPPRIVIALGVYRSASTWAANVIAEILRLHGPARIVVTDLADPAPAPTPGDPRLVVKVHRPSPALQALIRATAPPVIITVREPLDCVASLMRQFGEGFEVSLAGVAQSGEAVLRVLDAERALVLRYETDARDAATVQRVAHAIGAPTDAAAAERIAQQLTPERVAAFIDAASARGAFGDPPSVTQSDPETHWHPRHIGSGLAGRHAGVLTPFQVAAVLHATQAFRRRLGYAHAADGAAPA